MLFCHALREISPMHLNKCTYTNALYVQENQPPANGVVSAWWKPLYALAHPLASDLPHPFHAPLPSAFQPHRTESPRMKSRNTSHHSNARFAPTIRIHGPPGPRPRYRNPRMHVALALAHLFHAPLCPVAIPMKRGMLGPTRMGGVASRSGLWALLRGMCGCHEWLRALVWL